MNMIEEVLAAATDLREISERHGVEPEFLSAVSRLLSAKGTVYVPLAMIPQQRALVEYVSDDLDVRASVMTPDEAETLNPGSRVRHVVHDSLRVPYDALEPKPKQPATYVLSLPFTTRPEFGTIEPFVEVGFSSASKHFDRVIVAGRTGIRELYAGRLTRMYEHVTTYPVLDWEVLHATKSKNLMVAKWSDP